MYIKTEGIVLRTVKYGDNSVIADIYTRSYGCLPFMVRMPSEKRKSATQVLLQPLTQLAFDADIRPKARLHYFKDARIAVPYTDLLLNTYKVTIALFLAEFLSHAIRREGKNEPLYEFIRTALEWLDTCEGNFANFHLVFLLRLSLFIGFYPNLADFRKGLNFDLLNGCFSAATVPAEGRVLAASEARFVVPLMDMNFDTMRHFRFTHEQRGRILEVLLEYYRLHIPDFPELHSLEVLKAVFA